MDMIWVTVLEGNHDANLWPKVILAMTYIKNVQSIKALEGNNPYSVQNNTNLDIEYLQVLSSTIYVFFHKEEQALKSEKWQLEALRETLIEYDGYIISSKSWSKTK